MQTIELIKSAIQSLKANKKRSFLTIIGIMIGIAAVIAILGIGDGITKTMYDKFGNNAKQGQQTTEKLFRHDTFFLFSGTGSDSHTERPAPSLFL